MTQEQVEAFVTRYLAQPADKRNDMLQELAQLTGVVPSVLAQHLRGIEDRRPLLERISQFRGGDLTRTDEELVGLVQRIQNGEGSEAETDEWLRVIEANVAAPIGYVTDLIFNPDEGQELSAKDIVALAKAYTPHVTEL